MENLVCDTYHEPFPHLIIKNFYNEEEVELIWEELNFYTKPGKLLEAQDFGGIIGKTNSGKSTFLNAVVGEYISIINSLGLDIIFTRFSVCIASNSTLKSVVLPANTPTTPPVAPAMVFDAIDPPAAAVVISPVAVGGVPPDPEIEILSKSLFLAPL